MMLPRAFLLVAVLAASSTASALEVTSPIDVSFLGQVDAMVQFCVNADPKSAATYRAFSANVTQGILPIKLGTARNSAGYLKASSAMQKQLIAVPYKDRVATCAALFAAN